MGKRNKKTPRKNGGKINKKSISKNPVIKKDKSKNRTAKKRYQKGGGIPLALGASVIGSTIATGAYKAYRLFDHINDTSIINSLLDAPFIEYSPKLIVVETKDLLNHYLKCISTYDLLQIFMNNNHLLKSKTIQNMIKTTVDNQLVSQKSNQSTFNNDLQRIQNIIYKLTEGSDNLFENIKLDATVFGHSQSGDLNKLSSYLLAVARIPGKQNTDIDKLISKNISESRKSELIELDKVGSLNPYLAVTNYRWKDVIITGIYDDDYSVAVDEILKKRELDKVLTNSILKSTQVNLYKLENNIEFLECMRSKLLECCTKPRGVFDYISSNISFNKNNNCLSCPDKDCLIYLYDIYNTFMIEKYSGMDLIDKIYVLMIMEARICVLSKCLIVESIRIQDRKTDEIIKILNKIYKEDKNRGKGSFNPSKWIGVGGGVDSLPSDISDIETKDKSIPKPPDSSVSPKPLSDLSISKPPDSSVTSKPLSDLSISKPPDSSVTSKPLSDLSITKPPDSSVTSKPLSDLSISKPPDSSVSPKPLSDLSITKPPDSSVSPKPLSDLSITKPPDSSVSPKPLSDLSITKPPDSSILNETIVDPLALDKDNSKQKESEKKDDKSLSNFQKGVGLPENTDGLNENHHQDDDVTAELELLVKTSLFKEGEGSEMDESKKIYNKYKKEYFPLIHDILIDKPDRLTKLRTFFLEYRGKIWMVDPIPPEFLSRKIFETEISEQNDFYIDMVHKIEKLFEDKSELNIELLKIFSVIISSETVQEKPVLIKSIFARFSDSSIKQYLLNETMKLLLGIGTPYEKFINENVLRFLTIYTAIDDRDKLLIKDSILTFPEKYKNMFTIPSEQSIRSQDTYKVINSEIEALYEDNASSKYCSDLNDEITSKLEKKENVSIDGEKLSSLEACKKKENMLDNERSIMNRILENIQNENSIPKTNPHDLTQENVKSNILNLTSMKEKILNSDKSSNDAGDNADDSIEETSTIIKGESSNNNFKDKINKSIKEQTANLQNLSEDSSSSYSSIAPITPSPLKPPGVPASPPQSGLTPLKPPGVPASPPQSGLTPPKPPGVSSPPPQGGLTPPKPPDVSSPPPQSGLTPPGAVDNLSSGISASLPSSDPSFSNSISKGLSTSSGIVDSKKEEKNLDEELSRLLSDSSKTDKKNNLNDSESSNIQLPERTVGV